MSRGRKQCCRTYSAGAFYKGGRAYSHLFWPQDRQTLLTECVAWAAFGWWVKAESAINNHPKLQIQSIQDHRCDWGVTSLPLTKRAQIRSLVGLVFLVEVAPWLPWLGGKASLLSGTWGGSDLVSVRLCCTWRVNEEVNFSFHFTLISG